MKKSIGFLLIGLLIGSGLTMAYEYRNWRVEQSWEDALAVLNEQLDKDSRNTLRAIDLFLKNPKRSSEGYEYALDRVVRILLRERALELWQYQRLNRGRRGKY